MSAHRRRVMAVVPARGGSKRIPRKNIRPFCGVPLIERTLEVVLSSGVFDAVVVSTDDHEIAELACALGAQVPFLRPDDLSDDRASTAPVVEHAIAEVSSDLGEFTAVCCVYPGAVLMTQEDFVASSDLADDAILENAVVAAVVRYGHPIHRALRRQVNGLMVPAFSVKSVAERTQDLEAMWHDAGQFYWASPARWQEKEPLLSLVVPYEVPAWRVQDIDSEEDWKRAEMLFGLARIR
jgi:pseudaminic acid cytidylyltransferase